jgi:hypothetical protein
MSAMMGTRGLGMPMMGVRDGEHVCVCAIGVSSIRKTDGDAGDCRCERDNIASDFEKVPSGARVDHNWQGGGRHFGIDNMAHIVQVISLFRVFCHPSGSVLTSLEAWDEIGSVATHRVRGGCSGLMALSWMVAGGFVMLPWVQQYL